MSMTPYNDGSQIPEQHPDPQINSEVVISALSAKLDLCRTALDRGLSLGLSTPKGESFKSAARHALREAAPETFAEDHPNCG